MSAVSDGVLSDREDDALIVPFLDSIFSCRRIGILDDVINASSFLSACPIVRHVGDLDEPRYIEAILVRDG
ncbi:hypothetical protein VTN96DRAFT_3405 [Rasamsonia emersonii]